MKRIITLFLAYIIPKRVTWPGVPLLLAFCLGAGVLAQGNDLAVTLTGLRSQTFPEVTASVVVWDANGPIEGLTAADFAVFEGSARLPVTAFTVESGAPENLRLVLALDAGLPELNLAEIKAAVIPLIGTLGSGDKAALLTFGDEVNLEYGFTNNTAALQGAVNRLGPRGKQHALHAAVAKAAAMLNEFSEGRKAIVVITTTFDTVGNPTADPMLSQVQQAGVPLFIVGVGDKVRGNHPLKTQTVLSGGQFITLNGTGQLQDTLLNLGSLLQKGYKITFQSGLKADNEKQPLQIVVTGESAKGAATGQFVATPGIIKITPQGIAANQTVSGVVNLAAEVISPAPLVSINYLLDDRLLAAVTTVPYSFAWDTTTARQGDHILTIKATDRAGNEGQVGLNVVISPPLHVSLVSAQPQVVIGQPATVQVKIESLTEVQKIEWLLNGELLESKISPPYDFSLDSKQYLPGTYRITVRVEDKLGHVVEDHLTMEFVSPPPPPPGRWAQFINSQRVRSGAVIGGTAMAVLAVMLLTIALFILIGRVQRKRSLCRGALEIANLGNIQSRYSLRAAGGEDHVDFLFGVNGAILPQILQPTPELLPAEPEQAAAPASRVSRREKKGVRQQVQSVEAVQSRVYGGTFNITQILDTISQLLPGSAGLKVARASQRISSQHATVDRAVRSQTIMVKTADHFRGQVAGALPGEKGKLPAAGQSVTGDKQYQFKAGRVMPGNGSVALEHSAYPNPANKSFETPWVEPGETLLINVIIAPRRPYRKEACNFTLTSQAIDQPDAPAVSEQGVVEIKGVFWLWRFLWPAALILAMAGLIGAIISLAVWRWFDVSLLSLLIRI